MMPSTKYCTKRQCVNNRNALQYLKCEQNHHRRALQSCGPGTRSTDGHVQRKQVAHERKHARVPKLPGALRCLNLKQNRRRLRTSVQVW